MRWAFLDGLVYMGWSGLSSRSGAALGDDVGRRTGSNSRQVLVASLSLTDPHQGLSEPLRSRVMFPEFVSNPFLKPLDSPGYDKS